MTTDSVPAHNEVSEMDKFKSAVWQSAVLPWALPVIKYLTGFPCRVRGHLFLGWDDAGETPGQPLPTAYCARCNKEL